MENSKFDNLIISTTDTVLGLGGRVSEDTKKLIFEIKKRDPNKKLIILVASIEQARRISKKILAWCNDNRS